ncbi:MULTISPECIES: mechanosensitive ion channel family protein [unclassified Nitratiruptor]|uniref:mechanosensitive ion channel family protein n=1 Tax=unclassified Nitratiruptor TaxID=2624044 RepID=UPI001938C471|nr:MULTISPECIES: mechanosensitive ion channel family protein [unclassified Nitratiruptor]BCD60676.1 MscS family membrane protein [Nitratiruptor sp. YY08-10]BCD64607.1 MscS family membrane protein [Nitratiruptor sp. YY08-14]
MPKIIFICLLFFVHLFALDINASLEQQNNPKVFETLLKDLNQSSPDYKLQQTLIKKIIDTLQSKPTLVHEKDFSIKNDTQFIATYQKINDLLAKAYEKKDAIKHLKDQLDDIEENIQKDPTNVTLKLEKIYYKKLLLAHQAFIDAVFKHYPQWLDRLLAKLRFIDFKLPPKKAVEKIEKKIAYLEKKIKKLSIEKERWEILENSNKVSYLQKLLLAQFKKKEKLIHDWLRLEFETFFSYLKKRSSKALHISQTIKSYVQKHSSNPYIPVSLDTSMLYMLNKQIGNWKIQFAQIKKEVTLFATTNTFLGMPLYKFAEGLGIFLLFLLLRKVFTFFVLKIIHKIAKLTTTTFDDKLLEIIEGPLKFAFIILGLYFAFLVMDIENEVFDKTLKSLIIFEIFWIFYNMVHVLDETIYKFAKRFGRELYREIGAFFIKTLKIFILAIGLVSILQVWNINVSAFLASLGLGGLAFALAAKDTAANLFGGLSILADRALKIDDWIKVGDVEGTVEDIGLRTTKVRTFEKSLVTVPNQMIANNPIENFSRRNIRRIKMRIGLVYSTTHEQMHNILTDIRNMLKSHPGIAKKATLLVNFDEFEDSSLSIFIYCFTNTADWAKYLEIKEDINLKIMEIVQRNGSDFAFPSESIYIEKIAEKE